VDLDTSPDDRSGKPILCRFLGSSRFHLRPELTGLATPKPAGRRVKRLERAAREGFPAPPRWAGISVAGASALGDQTPVAIIVPGVVLGMVGAHRRDQRR
jgi:hypothetical protein